MHISPGLVKGKPAPVILSYLRFSVIQQKKIWHSSKKRWLSLYKEGLLSLYFSLSIIIVIIIILL
jgi:hypothetical protein